MAEYNGTIDLISGIRPKNNGTFPLVDAKDVQMPDGTRLSEFKANADIPYFDLAALGLTAATLNSEAVSVETDTTAILEAISKGQIKISIPIKLSEDMDEMTISAISGNAMFFDGGAVITAVTSETYMTFVFTVNITSAGISVVFTSLRELPAYTAGDAKKVLSVNESGTYAGWSEIEGGETPVFDLAAMGLPNLPYGEEGVQLETDTTEIMAALAKGEVSFKLNATLEGETASFTVTVNPIGSNGFYICAAVVPMVSPLDCILLQITDGIIMAGASYISLGNSGESTTPPTSIDLSALESSGQIVETYADGSSKTSTIEFDTDGNPTQITDGDGNVTTFTW